MSPLTRIRDLNDTFRRSLAGDDHHKVLMTQGVAALPIDEVATVLMAVRQFVTFSEDNDPHGEHDFGAFDQKGVRYFWKIDCYDRSMTLGSPDAADPSVTVRVLTIMRADEY